VTENKPDIFETDYTMLDDFGILNSTQKTSGPTYISSGTTQNVPAGVYKIRWPEFRETYSTLGGQSCYDQGNKNSQYGVLTVEPGGFYDCRILFVAKLIGGGGPDNPTIDYCANLDGIQSTIPEGMSLDNYGNCTSNGVDMCTNIIGIQSVIPDGLFADGVGGCVATPPVDMCPNIDGVQVVIPSGYVLNGVGACVPVDFCPNVAGIQTTMPDGYAVDTSGDCVPTCDPAVDADCPDPDYFGFTLSTIPAIDTYIGNTVTRYTSVIKDITSGHDESIRFSVSGIPEGVTVVPVRGTCVSSDSCMFTINVTGTQEVPGASFTVTAISETGKIASTDVSITIGANPNTDFDFSLSPVGSQNIPVGTSVKVYTKATVTIPGKKNNPKVDMTISNIRNMSGASAGGIEVTSISSGKNCSFTCTFNMDIKGITEGSYIFTITGVSEGVTHAMDVQVTVSPRAFDFSLSDPTNIVLYRGSTLSSSQQNISAKKAEGSSWDEGIQFSMSPTTAGGLTITTVKDGSCTTLVSLCEYVKNFSAPSTATLGEYTFDVTAVSTGVSKITRTKTFTVEVKDKVCLNGETLVNGECVASCTLQVDGCNVNECPVGYIWDNGSCKKGGSTYSCNTQGQFVVNKVCVFCFGVGCSPIQPNDNDNACSIKEKRGTNTVYEVNPTDTGYTYYWYDFLYPAGQGPFSGTASEYSSSANRVSVVAMSPNNLMKIYHCPDTSKYKRDIKYEEF